MKILILLLIFFNFETELSSDTYISDYFKIINSGNFPKRGKSPLDYIKKFNENKIMFLVNPKIEVDMDYNLELFIFDNKNWQSFNLKINENDWIFDFDFYKNNIYILGQFNIYQFTFQNNKIKLENTFIIENNVYFNLKCISKNKLFLHSNRITNNNHIEIALWEKGKIKHTYREKSQLGIAFSLIRPRRNISFYKDKIVLANFIDYKIRVLDTNLVLLFQINDYPKLWKYDKSKYSEFKSYSRYDDYQKNPEFLYDYLKENSTICFADMLNDSILIVQFDIPNKEISENILLSREKYYNVYNLSENKAKIVLENIKSIDYKNEYIKRNDILKFGTTNVIDNGVVLIPSLDPKVYEHNDLLNFKESKIRYNKYIDNYYLQNELYGSFYILKWEGEQ